MKNKLVILILLLFLFFLSVNVSFALNTGKLPNYKFPDNNTASFMNSKNLNFGEIVHFYMGRTEEVYMYPELNPVWDSNYLQLIDKKPTPMGPMGDKRMIYTFMPLKRGETIIYNATWRQDIHHSDPPYRNIVINLWGAIR